MSRDLYLITYQNYGSCICWTREDAIEALVDCDDLTDDPERAAEINRLVDEADSRPVDLVHSEMLDLYLTFWPSEQPNPRVVVKASFAQDEGLIQADPGVDVILLDNIETVNLNQDEMAECLEVQLQMIEETIEQSENPSPALLVERNAHQKKIKETR